MLDENYLQEFQEKLGYFFNDESLLKTALTHSSYVNEANLALTHNERLEFLGDAVVGIYFSEELFKRFEHSREGELTNMRSSMVSGEALSARAKELGLDKYLRLGKGEEQQGGRRRSTLLANAFEAVIGAMFLDGGYEAVQRALSRITLPVWNDLAFTEKNRDSKSLLQELMQQEFKIRPSYELIETSGPEHEKFFTIEVVLPDGEAIRASGTTVKKAEQKAAGEALAYLLSSFEKNDNS